MSTVLAARKAALGALAALALLAGAMFIGPTPKASASIGQCPEAVVICVWSQTNYEGNFSYWSAAEWGCHTHELNPNIRSVWNRTGLKVVLGGRGYSEPHERKPIEPAVTGLICWPE